MHFQNDVSRGLKPAAFLYGGSQQSNSDPTYMKAWKKVEQMLGQVSTIRSQACPTLFLLCKYKPSLEDAARLFSGVQYFGNVPGASGYTFNGPFHTHPDRTAGLWAKEILLDLLGAVCVFPSKVRSPDRFIYTPVGDCAWDGFIRAAGLQDDPPPITCAVDCFRRVLELQGKYGDKNEDITLRDVHLGFFELRKFCNDGTKKRREIGGLKASNPLPVPESPPVQESNPVPESKAVPGAKPKPFKGPYIPQTVNKVPHARFWATTRNHSAGEVPGYVEMARTSFRSSLNPPGSRENIKNLCIRTQNSIQEIKNTSLCSVYTLSKGPIEGEGTFSPSTVALHSPWGFKDLKIMYSFLHNYNPPEKNLTCFKKFGDVFGKFLEGFGGVFGRCLGNILGHVWEVFDCSLICF